MPPPADSASTTEAATSALTTRIIRKLPPPRTGAESETFPQRALHEVLRSFRRDRGALWLWNGIDSDLRLAASIGADVPEKLGLENSPGGGARSIDLVGAAQWAALASAKIIETHPLMMPGRLIGVLALGGHRTLAADSSEPGDLEVVCSYLAGLLGGDLLTRRIKETDFELRYRLWELEALYDIGLSIAGNLDVHTLTEEILLRGLSLVNARRGSLDLFLTPETGSFHRNFGGAFLSPERVRSIAEGLPILHGPDGSPSEPSSPYFLAVPIQTEKRRLGLLAVAEKEIRGGTVHPFDANDLRTMTLLAGQAAIAIENARLHEEAIRMQRIEQEIEVAASIQRETLPQSVPVVDGITLQGKTRPTRAIGGDYFDYLPLPGGRLVAVLADVSGKGIPASLLVSTLSTGLHLVVDDPFDPVAAVARLDRHLLRYSAARKFVTLALMVLDPGRNRLQYVSAGHNPAFLVRRGGEISLLHSTGIPLGMFEGRIRECLEISFEPGDRICVYSDGITEAINSSGEEFGMERLERILLEGQAVSDESLCEKIFDAVLDFAAGVPQYDDQTLLVVTRTPRP